MLDIIIPAFNSVDLTWRCIQHVCLFPSRPPFGDGSQGGQRIILVDDGSTDDTPLLGEWLNRHGHVYLRRHKNGGPYAAWNDGISVARDGCRVVFLNNDVSVFEGALTALEESPFPYTCASEVIGEYMPVSMLTYTSNFEIPPERFPVGYLHSCFAVDLALIKKVGGFDSRFYLTYGDTDFMLRCKSIGIEPRVDKACIVHHGVSMTRRREFGCVGDAERDLKDRQLFEQVYAAKPEVLAEHPMRGLKQMVEDRTSAWAEGETVYLGDE